MPSFSFYSKMQMLGSVPNLSGLSVFYCIIIVSKNKSKETSPTGNFSTLLVRANLKNGQELVECVKNNER